MHSIDILRMHRALIRKPTRLVIHTSLAAIAFSLCQPLQAGDTRRCQLRGKTVITNMTCEQLANEAGVALPAPGEALPPGTTNTPSGNAEQPKAQLQADTTPRTPPLANTAATDGLGWLRSIIFTLGIFALLVAGLLSWLKHKARQTVRNRFVALAPIARDVLEPMLDKVLGTDDEELPYRQAPVMSSYEREMFERLKAALPECEIFPQVPLASFIRIDAKRAGKRYATNSYRWQNRIGQQRVDFLACLRQNMTTVAAVELDDPSHESADAQRRDAKKNKSLSDADVPLIRWRVETMPETTEIRGEFLRRRLLVQAAG